jgi:hypothetical protein
MPPAALLRLGDNRSNGNEHGLDFSRGFSRKPAPFRVALQLRLAPAYRRHDEARLIPRSELMLNYEEFTLR